MAGQTEGNKNNPNNIEMTPNNPNNKENPNSNPHNNKFNDDFCILKAQETLENFVQVNILNDLIKEQSDQQQRQALKDLLNEEKNEFKQSKARLDECLFINGNPMSKERSNPHNNPSSQKKTEKFGNPLTKNQCVELEQAVDKWRNQFFQVDPNLPLDSQLEQLEEISSEFDDRVGEIFVGGS